MEGGVVTTVEGIVATTPGRVARVGRRPGLARRAVGAGHAKLAKGVLGRPCRPEPVAGQATSGVCRISVVNATARPFFICCILRGIANY